MSKQIEVQKKHQLTGHNASIFDLIQGKDEFHFCSAAGDGWIAEWDIRIPETGKLIAQIKEQVFSICYLREEQMIVIGNMNGGVHWVDINDESRNRNIQHHQKGVFEILKIKNSVFTVGGGGVLTRWNIQERRAEESIQLSAKSLRGMDYSSSRNEIAVGVSDHHIYFVNADDLSVSHIIEKAHENSVFSVKYHPHQSHLLSGGRDAHLNVWDLESMEKISSQPAHWFTINDIIFRPDGKYFATASRDKTLKIWDADNYKLLKVLETIRDSGHLNSVNTLHWSSHQNYLLSSGDDRSIIVWELKD